MENLKQNYEELNIELIPLGKSDVIVTSGAFNGDDDNIGDWS
jgi:hypothetical protein